MVEIVSAWPHAVRGGSPLLSILVWGGAGQLGRDLAGFADRDLEVLTPNWSGVEHDDPATVESAVEEFVGRRRDRRVLAIDTGDAGGSEALILACSRFRLPLIRVTEDDAAAGTDSWIVRRSWIYGATGEDVVAGIIGLQDDQDILTVPDDECGSPTWTADLAGGLMELAHEIVFGGGPDQRVLRCANTGHTTRYGLARAILDELGSNPSRVRPGSGAPSRSVVASRSGGSWQEAGLAPLRHWRPALHAFLATTHPPARRRRV